ncbi:hypothetical protein F4775DRAFT_545085 [Biscogniauxia sp. FL1348]|nr:hypothetical protein F4775DRAFT_545085 [Biscogniauxia sp. FL1348]
MASSSALQVMQSSASSASHQPRASTAPVLEFVCLFTHDLRRKQKRWQDGRLKYHTFNKRVMVYDERGNFVGDTHWCEDYDFGEGEELQLERGSSIVQVAECVGSRDQDLSELVDKRAQEKVKRQSAALARRAPPVESTTPQAASPHFQLQQRPLHSVIGTPTGHHGRAVLPVESPFEERQRQVASPLHDSARPAKRRKPEISPPSKSGYAQSLFGATLTLSGRPLSSAPIRHQPPKVSHVREDNQTPASSDPSRQDGDLDSLQTATPKAHIVPKAWRPGLLNIHPGSSLLKSKPPRPPAQVITIDDPDVPSSPPRNEIDNVQQISSFAATSHTKNTGSRRAEKMTSLKVQNALQSTSVNRNLRNPQERGDVLLKANTEHHVPEDRSLAKHVMESVEDEKPQKKRSKMIGRERSHSPIITAPGTSKTASLTPGQEPSLAEASSVNQPRTELRIKPRKKRGLLMMSERRPVDSSISVSNKAKTRKKHGPLSNSVEELLIDDLGEANSRKEVSPLSQSRDDAARLIRGDSRLIDDDSHDPAKIDESQREAQIGCAIPTRKARRNNRREANSPGSGDEMTAGKQNKAPGVKDPIEDESGSSRIDPSHHSPSPLDDDSSEEIRSRNRRNKTRKQTITQSPEHGNNAQTDEDSPPRKRRSLRKKKTQVETVEEEQGEPESAPPPRLAHLGRKNIRSKEVIGFVFDEDDVKPVSRSISVRIDQPPAVCVQADQSTGKISPARIKAVTDKMAAIEKQQAIDLQAQEHISVPMEGSTITKPRGDRRSDTQDLSVPPAPLPEVPLRRQDSATSSSSATGVDKAAVSPEDLTVTKPQSVPIPKLINPATRGRKAAKPSDAAGQMPKCPLPPEVGPHATSLPTKPPNPKKRSGPADGKAASAPMPGFGRANGGPWSREAHDLFEFRRPP